MTNNINYKMKDAILKMTFNNQNAKPINNGSNKKNSINFNNVIKNLSASPDVRPWYKKKASIIAMSSTLGVGVLATAIAVPIVLTSQSDSVNTLPPLPPEQQIIVDEFNAKLLNDKIISYNSIATNVSNKNAIQSHFLDPQINGFRNFFLTNIAEKSLTSNAEYNSFKTFLMTSTTHSATNPFFKTLTYSTTNGNVILNIIESNGQVIEKSRYFTMNFTTTNDFLGNSMYSPFPSSIQNLTIENDFSIKLSFKNNTPESNMIAFAITPSSLVPFNLFYKQDIIFNNSTLFSGMQEYVKTSILQIK